MPPKKSNNPAYVTLAECTRVSSGINTELITIKKALVGDDMRGGVVKDVADIKANLKNSHGLGKRERAMIYVAVIGSGGLIVVELLKFLATIG